jgi:hypothetical protein
MSCGCSNTTPTVTTTNCGSCGYNCSNCTCSTNPIIEPDVVCSDPEPCSELFPLECVIYTGEDIACAGTANTLYPNVIHYLALENSSTTARNFVSILNNINEQLCYLFSKNYISQLLTNIQNDETLSALFCSIASSCDCDCNITCGTVNSATYVSNPSGIDTISVNFAQVTGGNTKTFSGTISGTTLTVTANPGSVVFAAGQKITAGTSITPNTFITGGSGSTWTLSQSSTISTATLITVTHITYKVSIYKNTLGSYYYINGQTSGFSFPTNTTATASISVLLANDNTENLTWLVTVQATDQFAVLPCTSGYYDADPETPVPVSNYDGCGFGMTTPVPVLECPIICTDYGIPRCLSVFNSPQCLAHWGTGATYLTFEFEHTNPPTTNYQVDYYIIHWYKQTVYGTTFASNQYKMQNGSSPDNTITVTMNPETFIITTDIPKNTTDNWLLLITPVLVGTTECNTGFAVRPYNEENPSATVPYLGSELVTPKCNWFIYDKK